MCVRGLKGVTVALSEDGRLSCSYLGTDPSMISHPTAYLRELDYTSLEAEMKQLQRVIKEHQSKICKRLASLRCVSTDQSYVVLMAFYIILRIIM